MKIRSIIFSAAALALTAVSCCSPTETVITGKFGDEVPSEVYVRIGDIDTTLVVENGTFSLSIPTDLYSAGQIATKGYRRAKFIPDGTELTADFSGEKPVVISSEKNSLNNRFNEVESFMDSLATDYREGYMELNMSGASEEEKAAAVDKFYVAKERFIRDLLKDNKDNYLAVYAVSDLFMDGDCDYQEIKDIINGFSKGVKESKGINKILSTIAALEATAEGKMFTDFTVNSVVGMTRSIPPQYKYGDVKLSDYVGKGKYILVDFWASWCGPCKREIPNLKAVYDKYHGDEFDMLSIAVWDETEASLKAAEELGMNWNHIVNAQQIPTDLYGIQGIPHIILFGPDGTILKRDLRGEAIEEEIAKYIKK